MLCSRSKQILLTKTTLNNNVQFRCFINARFKSKGCFVGGLWASLTKNRRELGKMSSVRYIFRDLGVNRLWNVWTRSVNIANVVKRYKKDRGMREVIECFRQTFLRPRRTLLISATAVFKVKAEDDKKNPRSSAESITDEELESLLLEMERIKELAKKTLYCENCNKRIVIDKKHPGVNYCPCKAGKPPGQSEGWEPYMEAEDVIIWRKEYKPGGLYAYKVYGRYKDVQAQDFAAVQVDGAYRRTWDAAVASLSVVERCANGVSDQAVLHWEVLWPRLFANRDYVYIRRHKEYDISIDSAPSLMPDAGTTVPSIPKEPERPNVHSKAKRKSLEAYSQELPNEKKNKVYAIVSHSCCHPSAPPTQGTIRVTEYWSHMIVRTVDGCHKTGMEFILTYYDEPAVGGMPSGVATWATGRAAPAYLAQMRVAARGYSHYREMHHQDMPDFTPFHPEKVSQDEEKNIASEVKEEDMESSKTGPEMESETETKDQETQTDLPSEVKEVTEVKVKEVTEVKDKITEDKAVNTIDTQSPKKEIEKEDQNIEDEENNSGWWRYFYPQYYFGF